MSKEDLRNNQQGTIHEDGNPDDPNEKLKKKVGQLEEELDLETQIADLEGKIELVKKKGSGARQESGGSGEGLVESSSESSGSSSESRESGYSRGE